VIVDVDTHFEPGSAWLDDRPDLAERIPPFDTAEVTARIVTGDLLEDVPVGDRPPLLDLMPPGIAAIVGKEQAEGYGYEGSSMHAQADAGTRVAWLDQVGTDVSSVICLEGMINSRYVEDRAFVRELLGACNTWLADAVGDHVGRLKPVACVDFTDLDWTVAELTRMRERGSRAFLLPTIPAPGLPPMHPSLDRVWAAAQDLGMIAVTHVGYNPAKYDPAWANVAGDYTVLRQLAVSQTHQSVQLMLNGMVFGGVFDRFPNLTVLIAECGVGWFEGTVDHMEGRGPAVPESALYLGPYPFALTPGETVRRNVRITPLPRKHQSPRRLLEVLPECVVFSSDYAHNEGSGTPLEHYAALLDGLDEATRAWFLGGNIADVYARMGDPLA
jgi:predicted TIM-barrel fold metal-dependent hydrolase